MTTTTTTEVTTTAETTAAVTTAKPEPAVLPLLSIDLNNDGVDEEIYIDDDRYRVVYNSDAGEYMYDTITTVGRPDKLYIYKCDDGSYFYLYDANDDAGFAQHNFVVTDHGLNKYVYSGVGCQTGRLLRYSDTFHDESIDRTGFNSVFFAPREQIAESISAEYLGILDIDALVNTERIEHHLKTIELATGAPPIDIYSLENDAFGARKMLKCNDRTVFSDDYDYLTVYSRFPEMAQKEDYTGDKLDPIIGTEREYLLCLSSRDIETADLIYMGYPDENYLVHYDKPIPVSEIDDYLAGQGWKLRSEKIDISYFRYSAPDEEKVVFDREKAAAEYSDYGMGLDVLMGSETKLVFCTDEEEFGEPELLQKLRESHYIRFAESIKAQNDLNPEEHPDDTTRYNELIPARTINEPADIPFIKGIHYDFDNDGEDEVIAMLGIGFWECVFYYADGDNVVNLTNIEFGATNGREADDDEICTEVYGNGISVWDFGKSRFFTHELGSPSVSFTTIYRCKDGGVFELVNNIATDYNSFDEAGFVWIKHHPNIFTHCDYLVCTPEGELKEIGNESITPEKFRGIYEKDEQMQAAFKNAELDRNTFGELDVNSITEVYMKGYYDFILIAGEQNEINWYYYCEGRVSKAYDIIRSNYSEDMLYDINLYKLNVVG
ncbi:MAG: hypothetical protein J6O50_11305 [Ruminiclostridium sp.]|nr:hypothetical protein [Ruminiclostridium sp.]